MHNFLIRINTYINGLYNFVEKSNYNISIKYQIININIYIYIHDFNLKKFVKIIIFQIKYCNKNKIIINNYIYLYYYIF